MKEQWKGDSKIGGRNGLAVLVMSGFCEFNWLGKSLIMYEIF
jgi:hypothetical protein